MPMPRALVIDDEPGIRLALKRWFERQGYSVLEAADGEAALKHLFPIELVDAEPISVVVCDLHLPGISGAALLERLYRDAPVLAKRLILTSGDAIDDAAPGSMLAQHPLVLQKPFDLATLRFIVDRVLQGG
jgi:CheY-like chemotaxis protein